MKKYFATIVLAALSFAARAGTYEQRTCALALVDYEKIKKECGLANVAEAINLFNSAPGGATPPSGSASLRSAMKGVPSKEAFDAFCEAYPDTSACIIVRNYEDQVRSCDGSRGNCKTIKW